MKPKNPGLSNAKIAIVVALFWTLVFAVFSPKLALALFIPTALFAFVMLCVITAGAKDDRE